MRHPANSLCQFIVFKNFFRKPIVLKTSQSVKQIDDPDHYFVEGLRAYNPTKVKSSK